MIGKLSIRAFALRIPSRALARRRTVYLKPPRATLLRRPSRNASTNQRPLGSEPIVQIAQRVVLLDAPRASRHVRIQMSPPPSHALLICPTTHLARDERPLEPVSLLQRAQLPSRIAYGAVSRDARRLSAAVRRRRDHRASVASRTFSSSSALHRSRRMFGFTLCLHRCAHCCPVLVPMTRAMSLHRLPYSRCNASKSSSSRVDHGRVSRASSRGMVDRDRAHA